MTERKPVSIEVSPYDPLEQRLVVARPAPVSTPGKEVECPQDHTGWAEEGTDSKERVLPSSQSLQDIAREVQRELQTLEAESSLALHPPQEASPPQVTYDLPITVNRQVMRYIRYFQTKGRKAFRRWLIRSSRYKSLMQEILRQYNLPQDLFYLAMIESGFNLDAYSRRHAVGPWQFIRSTARKYGLTVNWWIDERRDPVKSTHAAARYLGELYREFGSWYLAMAAYNGGEARIDRAIRRYKTKEFWKLCQSRYLKRETRNYVPKVLAAAIIAKQPEKYGFTDLQYLPPLEFEEISVDGPLSLKALARAAQVSYRELATLNTELRRKVVPPYMRGYILKVPKNSKELLLARYLDLRKTPPPELISHRIKRGETLYSIARAYGTTVRALADLNKITNPRRIRAGRTILVAAGYGSKYARTSAAVGRKRKARKYAVSQPKTPKGRRGQYLRIVHRVKKGDTLWKLSRKYGVNWKDFYKWNEIGHYLELKPGDLLTVYVKQDT